MFLSKKKNKNINLHDTEKVIIGEQMSFQMKEAFNLLRTNLIFSFSDEVSCRMIGVLSAQRGDGKSISCINCAYSFATNGSKVLILDCDLRLPTIGKKLGCKKKKGVSDWLTGQAELNEIIQQSNIHENLEFIVAGEIPPNPSQLLGSEKMQNFLKTLSQRGYEYIFIDMPPVGVVSDAIILSHFIDGVVLVVRQDYTDKTELKKTINQLQFAAIKVLGFLFNDYLGEDSGYYRNYRKYGKKYAYYKKN